MTVLSGVRVATFSGVLDAGWLDVANGRIAAVGAGPGAGSQDLGGGWLLPGFVGLHVHGEWLR